MQKNSFFAQRHKHAICDFCSRDTHRYAYFKCADEDFDSNLNFALRLSNNNLALPKKNSISQEFIFLSILFMIPPPPPETNSRDEQRRMPQCFLIWLRRWDKHPFELFYNWLSPFGFSAFSRSVKYKRASAFLLHAQFSGPCCRQTSLVGQGDIVKETNRPNIS